ncbi:MAG TPA: hypothetical protein RWO09_09800 [Ruminococcus sp.]
MNNNRKVSFKDKQEQYKNSPERTTVQVIDGCCYIVHSHFVGDKDLDEVMNKLAFETAMRESLTA